MDVMNLLLKLTLLYFGPFFSRSGRPEFVAGVSFFERGSSLGRLPYALDILTFPLIYPFNVTGSRCRGERWKAMKHVLCCSLPQKSGASRIENCSCILISEIKEGFSLCIKWRPEYWCSQIMDMKANKATFSSSHRLQEVKQRQKLVQLRVKSAAHWESQGPMELHLINRAEKSIARSIGNE